MQIVSHLFGAISRFVTLDEILPPDRASFPMFAQAIQDRFNFQTAGDSQSAANSGYMSSAFQNGRFTFKDVDVPIIAADFHGQSIQVVCTKTEQAAAFIDETLQFLVDVHGFKKIERKPLDLPTSSLIVDFGPTFFKRFGFIQRLTGHIETALRAANTPTELHPQSLKFSGRTTFSGGRGLNVNYILEERSGRPTGTNWLFSSAPLSSEQHVAMLSTLEDAISEAAES